MSTLQDADLFIVDRNGTNYQLPNSQMSTLQDTDLFVVERSGVSYKIEAKDVNTGPTGSIETPVAVLTPLNGAGTNAGQPYNPLSTAITAVGADGDVVYETDTIASVQTFSPPTTGDTGNDQVFRANQTYPYVQNGFPYSENTVVTYFFDEPISGELRWSCDGSRSNIENRVLVSSDGGTNTVNAFQSVPRNNNVYFNSDNNATISSLGTHSNINWMQFKLTGANDTCQPGPVSIGEEVVMVTNNGVSEILTFPTSNNFDKFEVGDVVQTEQPVGYTLTTYNGATNSPYPNGWVLDGSSSTRVRTRFQANLTVPVLNGGSKVTFWNNSSQVDAGDGVYFVIDTDGIVYTTDYSGPAGNIDLAVPVGVYIQAIGCSKNPNGNGGNFNYIKINGTTFVLPPAPSEGGSSLAPIKYSITNIDIAASTMAVNGGTWDDGDVISRTVSSDATLTFTSPLELANMVGPLSQVDENGDVKTPVTSEVVSVQSGMTLSSISCEQIDGTSGIMSAIYVDGVQLTGNENSFGTTTQGEFYALNQLFNGNSESVTYSINGYSTFTFSPPITVNNSLEIRGYKRSNGANSYVNNVVVPGLIDDALTTVPFPIGIQLTFESPNPDLQFFQPGDQIGTYPFTASRSVTPQNESYFEDPQNMENCWDGDLNSTGSYMSKVGTGNAYFTFNIDGFTETISYEETIHVRVDAPSIMNSGKAQSRFNFSEFGNVNVPGRDAPVGGTGSWISFDVGTLINSGTLEYGGATTMSSASNGTRIYFGSTVITNTFSGEIRKILTQDVQAPIYCVSTDTIANTMTVEPEALQVGETAVGQPLIASADDVEYLDGNTLGVNGVSGTWLAGLHAQGAEITATAPSPESIQYTSANGTPLTTPFTGTDASLTTRTWTWQVSNAVTGPWTDFATRIDAPGQDGAVPLADRPTLEPNKFYQVKVRYDSENAEYVESTFNTFKTGDN